MDFFSGTVPVLIDPEITKKVSKIKFEPVIPGPTLWSNIKGWSSTIYTNYIADNKLVVLFAVCLIIFLYYRYRIKQSNTNFHDPELIMQIQPNYDPQKEQVNIKYTNSAILDKDQHDNYNSYKPDTPYNQQVFYPANPDIAIYPDDRFSNQYFLPYSEISNEPQL